MHALTLMLLAASEIAVAPTLEWMADHCVDSGIYMASGVRSREDAPDIYDVRLRLRRVLRGEPAELLREAYSRIDRRDRSKPVVRTGDEFLVSFQHYSTGEKRPVHLINLTRPQQMGARHVAVTAKLELLKTGRNILRVFEGRLQSHPRVQPVEISDYSQDNRFELSPEMAPYAAIYSGSSCFLRIPKDLTPPKK